MASAQASVHEVYDLGPDFSLPGLLPIHANISNHCSSVWDVSFIHFVCLDVKLQDSE